MEHVLREIAVEVARYLTPHDLSSCVGVSLHWREVFGCNEIWKHLCDLEVEDYTKNTPCVVTPTFEITDQDDSSLPPLSRWRAAFLREQHLWRNWRSGNCKIVEHKMEDTKIYLEQFISNDLIVSFHYDCLNIWDTKTNPPTLKCLQGLLTNAPYIPSVYGNGIIILKNCICDDISIFKVDLHKISITPKWRVKLERGGIPKLISCKIPVENLAFSLENFYILVSIEERCIGYSWFPAGSEPFYVWDLKNGRELKKETCPKYSSYYWLCVVGGKLHKEHCKHVIVLLLSKDSSHHHQATMVPIECQIYDIQQLKFLPFKQRFSVSNEYYEACVSNKIKSFDLCSITENFLAVADCGNPKTISIFDFRNGLLLHKLEGYSCTEVIYKNCFMFAKQSIPTSSLSQNTIVSQFSYKKGELCSISCPSGDTVKNITRCEINHFKVLGKGLVEVILRESSEVWRVNQFLCFKPALTFQLSKTFNRSFSMSLSNKRGVNNVMQITHFW